MCWQQQRRQQLALQQQLLLLGLLLAAWQASCNYCCPQGRCKQKKNDGYDVCDDDPCYSTCKNKDQCWSRDICSGKSNKNPCLAKGPTTWCTEHNEDAVCESKPPVKNAKPCAEGNEGGTCQPSCADGFTRPTGATDTPVYKCTALGTWEPESDQSTLTCVKQCKQLPAANYMNTSECGAKPLHSTCKVGCEQGYVNTVEGGQQQGVQYVCTADGTWRTSESLACQRVVCGARAPTNHSRTCAAGDGYAGGECRVLCEPGYKKQGRGGEDGALDFSCSSKGHWLPDPGGTCQKLQGTESCCPGRECCRNLSNSSLVNQSCTTKDSCLSAAGCNGAAPTGFAGAATWCVDREPTNCPSAGPDIQHASGCGNASSDQASQCTMKCDQKYVPADSSHSGGVEYVCSSGRWKPLSGQTLTCHAGCPALEPIENAHHNCTDAYDGNRCTAQCNAGYVNTQDADEDRVGPWSMANETMQYVCQGGQWQPHNSSATHRPQAMVCQPTICNAVPPVSNANSCESEAGGETCDVACIDGYNNTANASSNPALHFTCQYNGVWVGEATCVDCTLPVHHAQCYQHGHSEAGPTTPAAVPQGDGLWLKIGGTCLALVLVLLVAAYCCASKAEKDRGESVLRESILGSEAMPEVVLAARDVGPRWVATNIAEPRQSSGDGESDSGSRSSNGSTSRTRMDSGAVFASGSRRVLKGKAGAGLPVMFTNDTMGELQPKNWRLNPLGRGAFGTVYKATWRGTPVAVKEITLPQEPDVLSSEARAQLTQKVRQVAADFVAEVEICCDLHHPNLVQLLGYATKPRLLIVQELLLGNALDKQLYVEKWRPDAAQQLKVALDVASGMEYLHTAFERDGHDQPLIHRDLKSPNLLLATAPRALQPGEPVLVKVTDFGLAKDKSFDAQNQQTAMMTGCGSVLWMAPEMLLGKRFNELIDVYSFAMCLVEVVDGRLPWSGGTVPVGAIPLQVTKGERPEHQLQSCPEGLAAVIRACWAHAAVERPSFSQVVRDVRALQASLSGGRSGRVSSME